LSEGKKLKFRAGQGFKANGWHALALRRGNQNGLEQSFFLGRKVGMKANELHIVCLIF
jgi:hypothetical protein